MPKGAAMIQIPTNARQKLAYDHAHQLRRAAFARLFTFWNAKGRPPERAGLKSRIFPESGEVLRPVCGNG